MTTHTPEPAHLLNCGLCYEENGEEVHPHPECPVSQPATPVRYRHRTADVDAVQWTGTNAGQLRTFAPDRFATAAPEDRIDPEDDAVVLIEESHWVAIRPGCWVVRYPDHFDVESDAGFRDRYEPVPVVPVSSPPPDQTALRDRIAEALYERERPPRDPHWPKAFAADREVFEPMAAAVLAVLPPPADRAAICRGLADQQTQLAVADDLARRRDMAAARRHLVKELRRLAAEAQQPATDTEHTPEPAQEA